MQKTAKMTRKGQITVSAELRKEYCLTEKDKFTFEKTDDKNVFLVRRVPNLLDLAGIFAGHADMQEIKKELDKIREEY
jgi:bifunctional DNA-binding transcriptional regulator/antitoxin component of YhaV-PrlF toxin-antitoxin module